MRRRIKYAFSVLIEKVCFFLVAFYTIYTYVINTIVYTFFSSLLMNRYPRRDI